MAPAIAFSAIEVFTLNDAKSPPVTPSEAAVTSPAIFSAIASKFCGTPALKGLNVAVIDLKDDAAAPRSASNLPARSISGKPGILGIFTLPNVSSALVIPPVPPDNVLANADFAPCPIEFKVSFEAVVIGLPTATSC